MDLIKHPLAGVAAIMALGAGQACIIAKTAQKKTTEEVNSAALIGLGVGGGVAGLLWLGSKTLDKPHVRPSAKAALAGMAAMLLFRGFGAASKGAANENAERDTSVLGVVIGNALFLFIQGARRP